MFIVDEDSLRTEWSKSQESCEELFFRVVYLKGHEYGARLLWLQWTVGIKKNMDTDFVLILLL